MNIKYFRINIFFYKCDNYYKTEHNYILRDNKRDLNHVILRVGYKWFEQNQ